MESGAGEESVLISESEIESESEPEPEAELGAESDSEPEPEPEAEAEANFPLYVSSRDEAMAVKKSFEMKSGISYIRHGAYAGR